MSQKNQVSKPFDVGGQAVMEGVMMRSPSATAVTVRRPDGTMVTKLTPFTPLKEKHPWMGYPFIRGVINMGTMLYYGMNTLQDSTTMLGILDEEPTRFEKWLSKKTGKSVDKIVMGVAIVLAVAMALGLFMLAPHLFVSLLKNAGVPHLWAELAGGALRILLLVGYMIICGFIPDVRKTFQYHGAEHKSVHCNESGKPLTPENAKQFSRLHPRCGTAFLLIVFLISMILSICVQNYLLPENMHSALRFLIRLAMLPVVAGLSYEVLMGLAHSKSRSACVLRWPGMQMQRLTTREPDESMLECAIVSVNVVLNGFPEGCRKSPEGWGVFHSYKESEPGYVLPEEKGAEEAEAAEVPVAENVPEKPEDESAPEGPKA
ncbi:MAG: DUF1385 domain-containing protein [Clostridiales bacterium]|nr:DUF1385 domain-containing protein [Clostridiales bacterium]